MEGTSVKDRWFAVRLEEQRQPEGSILAVVKADAELARRVAAAREALASCGGDELHLSAFAGGVMPYRVTWPTPDMGKRSAALRNDAAELFEDMAAEESGDPDSDDSAAWCRRIRAELGEFVAAIDAEDIGALTLVVNRSGEVWLRTGSVSSAQWYASVDTQPLKAALDEAASPAPQAPHLPDGDRQGIPKRPAGSNAGPSP